MLTLTPSIHTALTDIRTRLDAVPLTQAIILVPSTDAIWHLRRALGPRIGARFVDFYVLAAELLDSAGVPVQRLGDTAVRQLIATLLTEMDQAGELTTFGPVRNLSGFQQVLLEWLREMQGQSITPEQYAAYQGLDAPRDRQLASFYTRYQSYLQNNRFTDADTSLHLAAEALSSGSGAPTLGQFFVLGFDQLAPAQLDLLQALQAHVDDLTVYLPWDPTRPQSDLPLTALSQTRQAIRALTDSETVLSAAPQTQASPLLQHLHSNVLRTGAATSTVDPDSAASLHMLACPSRESEIRHALRAMKQLLLDGIAPQDIHVFAPSPSIYQKLWRTVGQEYGLPVEIDQPLTDQPIVSALLNALHLYPDFRRHKVLEVLRSPFVQQPWLSTAQIDTLDRLSRERPVIAGREQWEFALRSPNRPFTDTEDEDLGSPPLIGRLPSEAVDAIRVGLQAFFDQLTPAHNVSTGGFIDWLQGHILGIDNEEDPEAAVRFRISSPGGEHYVQDQKALQRVRHVLRQWLRASEQVVWPDALPEAEQQHSIAVFSELIGRSRIPPERTQPLLRLQPLEEARHADLVHTFVLGLSEGEFPTPPPPDPFYREAERQAQQLAFAQDSPGLAAARFWQLVANTREKLTLLRPKIDERGAPWQASPFWDAVLDVVRVDVEDIPVAEHLSVITAASPNEFLVALAQNGAGAPSDDLAETWHLAQAADRVLRQRRARTLSSGSYEGDFRAEPILDELSGQFGPEHIWSASRLNRYAHCPFGFFGEYILNLEALEDPEEGLNPMQRGGLLHAVLEHLFRGLTQSESAMTADNLPQILVRLAASCQAIFEQAPLRYGFRPDPLWAQEQAEMQRLLAALITQECEENGQSPRYAPILQEARFGLDEVAPLEVTLGETHIRLRGVIDRVDRDAQGNLRVIDYKSGAGTISVPDMTKGLAFQTALYALAAEQFWLDADARVVESYYLSIPNRKAHGKLKFAGAVANNDRAEAILEQAAWTVESIRSGSFPSAPAKPAEGWTACRTGCPYASLCRVNRYIVMKARAANLA
jgi:ATP-dependent helicase/DNAse subunit B